MVTGQSRHVVSECVVVTCEYYHLLLEPEYFQTRKILCQDWEINVGAQLLLLLYSFMEGPQQLQQWRQYSSIIFQNGRLQADTWCRGYIAQDCSSGASSSNQ